MSTAVRQVVGISIFVASGVGNALFILFTFPAVFEVFKECQDFFGQHRVNCKRHKTLLARMNLGMKGIKIYFLSHRSLSASHEASHSSGLRSSLFRSVASFLHDFQLLAAIAVSPEIVS